MNKLLEHKSKRNLVISILFLLVVFVLYSRVVKIYGQPKPESFSNLLSTHNIIVEGDEASFTKFQLSGLIDELNPDNTDIIAKYEKKLSSKGNNIPLTAEEILELEYYSKTTRGQEAMLDKISGEKVSISCKDGAILISYNISNNN